MEAIPSIIPLSYAPLSTSLPGFPATGTVIRLSYPPITSIIFGETASGGAVLSGAIASTVAFVAILKVRKLLSGVIISEVTWLGVLTTGAKLFGNISATGTFAGVLHTGDSLPAQLTGNIQATGIFVGLLTARVFITGDIASDVTFTGTLRAVARLVGVIAGDVTFVGAMSTRAQLMGDIAGSAVFGGVLKARAQLIGEIAGTGSFAGSLKTKVQLVGVITADVTFAGTLTIAGGSYDADAQALFDAAGITDSGQKDKANALILAWKAAGLWDKTYVLYLFKTGTTAAQHSYNAKDPDVHQITWGGSTAPSHSGSGVDFTGAGYGNTGVIPSTHLALNSAGAGHYTTKEGTNSSASVIWGCYDAGDISFLYFDSYDASNYQLDINTNNHLSGTQPGGTILGLHSTNRASSTNMSLYRDGTLHQDTNSSASVSRPTISIFIGALNNLGSASHFSTQPVQIFYIKSEFWSATEESDAETAIADYVS